jgi:hypothetical protein
MTDEEFRVMAREVRLRGLKRARAEREAPTTPDGGDALPLFWIAFFLITCSVAAYFGANL